MDPFLGGFRLLGMAFLPWWGWPIDRTTTKKVSFFLSSLLGSILHPSLGLGKSSTKGEQRQTR
jgi:hypothetical protein